MLYKRRENIFFTVNTDTVLEKFVHYFMLAMQLLT